MKAFTLKVAAWFGIIVAVFLVGILIFSAGLALAADWTVSLTANQEAALARKAKLETTPEVTVTSQQVFERTARGAVNQLVQQRRESMKDVLEEGFLAASPAARAAALTALGIATLEP